MLKSKIEVREFAVQRAAEIMGTGTPDKDVVAKAKEIEAYVIGDADLPEVHDELDAAGGLLQDIFNALGRATAAPEAMALRAVSMDSEPIAENKKKSK